MLETKNLKLQKPDLTDIVDIGVINANMDKIDQNLYSAITTKASITTSDLTYYVNANTGSDSNDGLTSGTAFRTIQKAVNMIPDVVKNNVTINVADGVYDEGIICNKLCEGATIFLVGNKVLPQNVRINWFFNVCSKISISGFEAISNTEASFITNQSTYTEFQSCISTSDTKNAQKTGFANHGGCVIRDGCIISNKLSAIYTGYCGNTIVEQPITGNNNTYGLTGIGKISFGGLSNGAYPQATYDNRMQLDGGIATGITPQRQQLPLASGFTGDIRLYKTAENIICVIGSVRKTNGNIQTFETIAELPVNLRPSKQIVNSNESDGSKFVATLLDPNGQLCINNHAQSVNSVSFMFMYVID